MKPAYEHIIKMQEIRNRKAERNERILNFLIASILGTGIGMIIGYLI